MTIQIDGFLEAKLHEAMAHREKLLRDGAAGKAGPDWSDMLESSSDSIVAIVRAALLTQEGES